MTAADVGGADNEFPGVVKEFLSYFEDSSIKGLADIVRWNEEHPEQGLPARK